MKLPTHNRYDYVPIDRREDYTWPGGKRLAVYFCNNIEYFAFGAGLGSDSTGGPAPQSQRNYAWRDYGNRVGIWRMFDLFDELACPLAHNLNAMILDHHPQIGERMMERGDEFVAHGRTNAERQGDLWEEDEARLIAETTETIRKFTGRQPTGWMSPWLSQSRQSLDLLQEAGYLYQCDWPLDDQPIWMRTRKGRILNMPYPVETNDSPDDGHAAAYRRRAVGDLDRSVRRDAGAVAERAGAGLPVRAAHVHSRPAIPAAAVAARDAAHPEAP